jgi:hypothetical protein
MAIEDYMIGMGETSNPDTASTGIDTATPERPWGPLEYAAGGQLNFMQKMGLALEGTGAGIQGRSPLFAEMAKTGVTREGNLLEKKYKSADMFLKMLKERREQEEAKRKTIEDHFKFADNVAKEIGKTLQIPDEEVRTQQLDQLRKLTHSYTGDPDLANALFNNAVNHNEAFLKTLETAKKQGHVGAPGLPIEKQMDLLVDWLKDEKNIAAVSLQIEREKGDKADPQRVKELSIRAGLQAPYSGEQVPGSLGELGQKVDIAGKVGQEQRAQAMHPFLMREHMDNHAVKMAQLEGDLKKNKIEAGIIEKVIKGGSETLPVGEKEIWEKVARNPEMVALMAEVQKERALLAGDSARYTALRDFLAFSMHEGMLTKEEQVDALKQMLTTRGIKLSGQETTADLIGKFLSTFGLPFDPRFSAPGSVEQSRNPVTVNPPKPSERVGGKKSPEQEAEEYVRPKKKKP